MMQFTFLRGVSFIILFMKLFEASYASYYVPGLQKAIVFSLKCQTLADVSYNPGIAKAHYSKSCSRVLTNYLAVQACHASSTLIEFAHCFLSH